MNANELRIGNWIKHKDCHLRVTEIGYLICCAPNWGFDRFVDIEGIPLTPELLEKCEGFVRKGQYSFGFEYNAANYVLEKQDDWWLIGISLHGITNYFAWHIYVHQLQNFFFCLTGTELTINLWTAISTKG